MSRLLYQEPRGLYLWDKFEDWLTPILLLFVMQFAIGVMLVDMITPGSVYEDPFVIFLTLFLMTVIAVKATWALNSYTVLICPRQRLEIYDDKIRFPYPSNKAQKRRWKESKGVVTLQSVASAHLEYEELELPFRRDRDYMWKCYLTLKNGEVIILSRSTTGCIDWRCFEAIWEFTQLVEMERRSAKTECDSR